jgi:hypothetical protein
MLTPSTFKMWDQDGLRVVALKAIAQGNTIAIRRQDSALVQFTGPSRHNRWVESTPVSIEGRSAVFGARYRNPWTTVCFFFLDGRSALGDGIAIEDARSGHGQKALDTSLMARQFIAWGPYIGTATFARSLAEYVSPSSLAATALGVALYCGSAWVASTLGLRALARVRASGQQVGLRSGLVVLAVSAFSIAMIFAITIGPMRPLLTPGN